MEEFFKNKNISIGYEIWNLLDKSQKIHLYQIQNKKTIASKPIHWSHLYVMPATDFNFKLRRPRSFAMDRG